MSLPKGLSSSEVQQRIQQGQTNSYTPPGGRTYWHIFRENVLTAINIILAIIALILVLVGKVSDGVIYFSIAFLNIIVGLAQEIYAKIKLDQMTELTNPKNQVVRDGALLLVNSKEIVLDDVILVEAGEIIPVDGIIIEGQIEADESLLTGESNPIIKKIGDEVLSGSTVATGQMYFRATAVGDNSMAARISSKAKIYHRYFTPLQQEINLIIRVLFSISATLGAVISFGLAMRGESAAESIVIIAVILGIVPNSLMVMVNLAYAVGAVRILRRGALVQQLNAVESLSNVNVLCVDKTGTLTSGQLSLEAIVTEFGQGDINKGLAEQKLQQFVSSITSFNSTTKAIQAKLGSGNRVEILEEVAFSSKYKWSGVLDKSGNALILGAPEILMAKVHDKASLDSVQTKLDHFQSLGQRTLIFAVSNSCSTLFSQSDPVLPDSLEIVSILVLSDSLRNEVQSTINRFLDAGVVVKIISGDNPKTVSALAKQIGFGEAKFVSGIDLKDMTESEFNQKVQECSIFGRITPEQKERIVMAIKAHGNYVAMIGDGVNDVMSLKAANLGIAMESGSAATRSVAEIILLKDSFGSLPVGLIEGQKIRSGLENVLKLYLTRVTFFVLILMATYLAYLPFPLAVKQKSFLSLMGNGLPSILLTLLARPKVNFSKSIISSVVRIIVPAGVSIAGVATVLLFALVTLDRIRDDLTLSLAQNQVTLLCFLILVCLILNVIISWPNSENGSIAKADWRVGAAALTSLVLATLLIICITIPAIAGFLGLVTLNQFQVGAVVIALPIWALIFLTLLKYKVTDKFFSRQG